MARFPSLPSISFTRQPTSGTQTIDALMRRQRELAALQAEQATSAYPGMGTVAGGLGHMLDRFTTGMQSRRTQDEEASARAQLAQAMAGVNMDTGDVSPEALQTMMSRDPDTGMAFMQNMIESRRAARAAALAAQQRTEERGWDVEDREDQQAAAVDAARARAVADAAQPQTTQAKLAADLAAKRIDQATYDAALKKANTSDGVTINTGDLSSALTKKFDEEEGKAWAGYLAAGNKAAGLTNDMMLLDELGKIAPQGPVPGTLAKLFPSATSAGAAFQSVATRLAPQMRVEGSGATSDIEYQGMVDSLPKLQNYPEANRLISGMMRAKAEIDMSRADIVTRWRNREIDDAAARSELNALNRKSIMSQELRSLIEAAGPAAQTPGGEGGALPEIAPEDMDGYRQLPDGAQYRVPGDTTIYTKTRRAQ